MIQQIGKYRIVERIGRGGMGSVFKAHDPVLDRWVAIKVVSTEADSGDELRARFFHEAQACAKLSHANIVTIYDLGEADGNLFIVMELLEGEELRQLIAKRTLAHLEEKLPLMVQICNGLDYAHGKGIVHRDVKPGNIFVLRNGQLKILDFGIARVETAETGLTRAGLIIGTLQYMAPERVRGHGDHRSDIFSVGAVFYELLTYRSPFAGDNAIEILENLRTQDPPRLAEVDPTLPPELDAIVERALQKDPARRFATLGEMRAELLLVRRRLAEDANQLRRRVQARLRQLRELREALATRVGGPWADETVLVIDERARLSTLTTVDRDVAARIERLQGLLTRAESLQPAFDRGLDALRRGEADKAVSELEHVVSEMPEHARAAESLKEARQVDERRQHNDKLVALLREAKAAHDAGAYARCLERLGRLVEGAPPADLQAESEGLRRAAEVALARAQQEASRRDALRRAHQTATGILQWAERARRLAEAAEAPQHAASLWNAADTKLAEGRAALAEEAYTQAGKHFGEALQLYERAGAGEPARAAIHRTPTAQTPVVVPNLDDTVVSEPSTVETPVPPAVTATPEFERSQVGPRAAEPIESASSRARRYLALSLTAGLVLAFAVSGLYFSVWRSGGSNLQHLRSTVLAARGRAVEAEAASLALETFSKAQAKTAEGDRLAAARNRVAATRAYTEAAEQYGEAARQAQTKREQRSEADAARARMVAAKERTRPDAAEVAEALVPRVKDPRAEIRELLNNYVRAVETKNVDLLRRVRPGLTDDELRRMRASNEIKRSHKVDLRVYEITLTGDVAHALGRREDLVVLNDGQRLHTETRVAFTLTRGPHGWVVHDVRESADRPAESQAPGVRAPLRSDPVSRGGATRP